MRARIDLWILALASLCTGCVAESHVGTSDPDGPNPSPLPLPTGVSAPRRISQITIERDPREWFGEPNEIVGDLDRDGFDDFLLLGRRVALTPEEELAGSGQPHEFGVAYLFYGRSSFPDDLSTLHADAVFRGDITNVSDLGDLNGDGFADFAIHDPSGAHLLLGGATRFRGEIAVATAGIRWTQPALPGSAAADVVLHVQRAGDVDGDGFDDLIVNTPGGAVTRDNGDGTTFQHWTTRPHVVLGRASFESGEFDLSWAQAEFWYASAWEWSSPYAMSAGDVDGDGFDDVMVYVDGQQYFYYGGAGVFSGVLGEAEASFVEGQPASGSTVYYAIGDLDGDGYDDLGLADLRGLSFVYGRAQRWSPTDRPQPTLLVERDGDPGYPQRMSGALARDIDGDRKTDLLLLEDIRIELAADGGGRTSDAIYLIRGSGTRLEGTYLLQPGDVLAEGLFLRVDEVTFETANVLLDAGGDVDGDGSFDILVSASNGEQSENAGKVLLFARTPIVPQ